MKVITVNASAGISGFESPASDYFAADLSLDELLILHPSASFIGKASGESMRGVGIMDGDLLIVDRAVQYQQGDVIVGCYRGEFVCKILDLRQRRLLSANPQFPPICITQDDGFNVEGVVMQSIRCHRPCVLPA